MDTFEYCSVRVFMYFAKKPSEVKSYFEDEKIVAEWLEKSGVVVTIEKDKVERFTISGALRTSNNTSTLTNYVYMAYAPLTYLLPYLNNLGKEGWEVVEYKSSEVSNFGEALLKRKIQKG